MTLVEHLRELRRRLIICAVAIAVGGIVAFALYNQILRVLIAPYREVTHRRSLLITDPLEGFATRLKIAAYGGLFLASPVVLYQLWRFVTPGLEARERKFAIPFVLSAVGLFVLGGYIAFLILPLGIHWLLGFVAPAQPLIQLTEYMSFVFLLILAFGISFEFPLLLVSLAGVGILSSRQLSKARRAAILIAFIIAAVATPSQDPISQVVMAVPLYILYELSIVVIRYGLKR